MAILNTTHTSKLVVGLDVTPNIIDSPGTAIINGPMNIGSPIPGKGMVNITLPGLPGIQKLLTSGIALSIVAPFVGIDVIAPRNNIVGNLDIVGSLNVTGFVNVAGRVNVAQRVLVGLSLDVFQSVRIAKYAAIGGPLYVGGPIKSGWLKAKLAAAKSFDINHPTKPKTHRLRYVCLEGPESGVYLRGKIKESNIITLPDYFKDLVDIETIVVNLTPIGKYQELYVEDIRWGKQVIIKNNLGGSVHCNYTIFAERKDVDKNIPEYEGTTPNDYPGDNSVYGIG